MENPEKKLEREIDDEAANLMGYRPEFMAAAAKNEKVYVGGRLIDKEE